MSRSLKLLLAAITGSSLVPLAAARPLPVDGPLALESGDLVVLLGDTFIERDGNYGHLESALTAAFAGKQVRFRNLGWSGDTPRAESRAYFGPPEEGFQRLTAQLNELKPTVVISCYGAVDAFKGAAGQEDFLKSYRRLLDMIDKTTGAGVVLMSPPVAQTLPAPFPDMKPVNENRAATTAAIAGLAKERGLRFADLFGTIGATPIDSENGVTFTASGYAAMTPAFLKSLGVPAPAAVSGKLRPLVLVKNQLYFYRWRPQNEIYLFGSRKHEQGNNASEVQSFEPLVAEKEAAIQALLNGN
jgi:GDSL-like Lipase/Acylhydrolase family